MGNLIKQLKDRLGITNIFPITKVKAVYDDDGNRLDNIIVKKGSSNTDNVGWSSGNYPYMTVDGSRKHLAVTNDTSDVITRQMLLATELTTTDKQVVVVSGAGVYLGNKELAHVTIEANGRGRDITEIIGLKGSELWCAGECWNFGTFVSVIINNPNVRFGDTVVVTSTTLEDQYTQNITINNSEVEVRNGCILFRFFTNSGDYLHGRTVLFKYRLN